MNIKEILEQHQIWLLNANKGKCANLIGVDLTRANLIGVDLTKANLTRADLTRVDLTKANLTRADLTGANLTRANLTGADLTKANLTRADLRETRGINCFTFDLRGYALVQWDNNGTPWVNAGCHSFSCTEAIQHWGKSNYPNWERGQQYVKMIKFILEDFKIQ